MSACGTLKCGSDATCSGAVTWGYEMRLCTLSWLGFLGVILLSTAACRAGLSLEVELDQVVEHTAQVNVSLTTEDGGRSWGSRTLPRVATKFVVTLPADASDRIRVRVSANDARDCLLADAQGVVELAQLKPLRLSLNDRSNDGCTVQVQVRGPGTVRVRFSEKLSDLPSLSRDPVDLGTASKAAPFTARMRPDKDKLAVGDMLPLQALPDGDAYFVGWSGVCRGRDACAPQVDSDMQEVRAIFAPRKSCTSTGFCWRNPLPQGGDLFAVFGFSADDIWAVGAIGSVLRFSGPGWASEPSGTTATLTGLWGSSDDDLWVVGERGTVRHFDGDSFQAVATEQAETLLAVWGSGPHDVWIVGEQGVILRYDGVQLQKMAAPTTHNLYAIWGSGPDDIWIVGNFGTVLHFDGSALRPVDSGTSEALYGVWGSGTPERADRELWISGSNQTLRVSSGGPFEAVPTGLPASAGAPAIDLYNVFGLAPSNPEQLPDLWAAGLNIMLHRDGPRSFRLVNLPKDNLAAGLWGSRPGDLWAVGPLGTIAHWDGLTFLPATAGPRSLPLSIAASAADDVFFGTADYTVWNSNSEGVHLSHRNVEFLPFALQSPARGELYAGLSLGLIQHRRDGNLIDLIDLGTLDNVLSLFLAGPDDLWAVGEAGLVGRYQMGTVTLPPRPTTEYLRSIHGIDANSLWAVGDRGFIAAFNGSTWQLEQQPSDGVATYWAVFAVGADDVWLAGDGGTIRRRQAGVWKDYTLPAPCDKAVDFFSIWGRSAQDVWLVGESIGGRSLCSGAWHWDGTRFTAQSGLPAVLSRVLGLVSADGSAVDLFVLGHGSSLLQCRYQVGQLGEIKCQGGGEP